MTRKTPDPPRTANWTVEVKMPPTALWLPVKSKLPLNELGRRAAVHVLGEGRSKDELEKFAHVIAEHTEDGRRRQVRKGGLVFFPDFDRLPPIATVDLRAEYSQTPPNTLDYYREVYGTPDRDTASPIEITGVELPAGPAVRFHNGYWHKSRLPIVIDRPHVHVTYAVRPPAIEDAVLLMVAWTEFKFSEMLVNMADAMAQTLEIKVHDAAAELCSHGARLLGADPPAVRRPGEGDRRASPAAVRRQSGCDCRQGGAAQASH